MTRSRALQFVPKEHRKTVAKLFSGRYEGPRSQVRFNADQFRETGNPVFALMSLADAGRARVAPDREVFDWFCDCVDEWIAFEGSVPLDHIMAPFQTGKTPPFKKLLLEQRDAELLMQLARQRCLGVKIYNAAELVHSRYSNMDQQDWSESRRWHLPILSPSSLLKKWKRSSPRLLVDDAASDLRNWTERRLWNYLQSFPDEPCSALLPRSLLKFRNGPKPDLAQDECDWP
jgi:hypothetical protein